MFRIEYYWYWIHFFRISVLFHKFFQI
uniref:Uncharacterized protein n=1 Tax=Arundo donax TaxID=35708 RepID=A0A0A8ZDV0_ARUDO